MRGNSIATQLVQRSLYPLISITIPLLIYAAVSIVLISLLTCYVRRLEANASLVLAITLRILVSVPFAPHWDADGMRAYAATNNH